MTQEICANCRADISSAPEAGTSSLYSPDEQFDLCITCFWEEDAFIEESGRNNHPERIELYRRNVEA